jgi:predicted TIM-barrel fold metal-dependent hydrolase
MPYLERRITRAISTTYKEYGYEEAASWFRRLYYDTALTSPSTYGCLLKVTEPSHIVFGSDYCMADEDETVYGIDAIDGYEGFDKQMREAIYYKNALTLLPRLQSMVADTHYA